MHDIIPSLQVALENELQERDFYLMHSRRTKNHLGRAMFEYIAKDEEEHYQRLQKAHEHLTRAGAWPENISLTVQKTSIMDVLLSIARRADITASPDLDDRKALQVAIDFETKAYEFYARLGKTTSDQHEQNFFNHLASMELEHLQALKETLLYFEDPATWFAHHEKPGLDG